MKKNKDNSTYIASIEFSAVMALAVSIALWLYVIPSALENAQPVAYKIPDATHRDCLIGANEAKLGFVGTKFENWNFYQSCVLNVECTTPLHDCPTEEIYEQSKFFVEK